MNFLLDTHTLAWAVTDATRLSRKVRGILEDRTNQLFVSAASVWELSINCKAGRWPQALPFMDECLYAEFLQQLDAVELAITSRHARTAGHFEFTHKDPFDRMIAAQAVLEGLPLLSKDPSFDVFPVTRIW